MKLKIAFLQLIPGVNIEDNIEKGIKACRKAKAEGADIALFPEMWSSGYVFPHNREWLEQNSVSLESEYVKMFSEIAVELDMAIAVTLLEKHEPKPRNTVCLFDRHGKPVYRYSKVHIIRQRKLCKNISMMTEHVDNFKMSKQDQGRNKKCKSAIFFCDGAYSGAIFSKKDHIIYEMDDV